MSATPTRATIAAALLLLGGCFSPTEDPTTRLPGIGDCLRQVEMKKLPRAIERCNDVVAAHPRHPQPRNERALLHSLAGDNRAACSDSQAAAALLERFPKTPPVDPLLVEEIGMRLKSCRQLTTAPAGAAPSPAGNGA